MRERTDKSEGKFIGFGCKDRYDALKWIDWMIKKAGNDIRIVLMGNSMGGATVLMASGLNLPEQVKGIVSDCAFTSPKAVFITCASQHVPSAGFSDDSDCRFCEQKNGRVWA